MAEQDIPAQHKGASSDTIAFREFSDDETARNAFRILRSRLHDVNRWQEYTTKITAKFYLCDASGEEKKGSVVEGDYFKMDGPGPGSVAGKGFDWVVVEKVTEIGSADAEETLIRVRPAPNPHTMATDTAHFFTEEASSSFVVGRKGRQLYAEVHGRNERPNLDAEHVVDKVRSAVWAAGAAIFYSKFQWKSLVKGLLDFEVS